jgi:peptidyl-prolyl cis-trans isomerase A (cyclophilin A)
MIRIRIQTTFGNILADLYDDCAPRTVKHFMEYVDSCYYNGSAFFRSARSLDNEAPRKIRIDVVQAGYYNDYFKQALITGQAFAPELDRKGPRPPIMVEPTSETGLKHVDGTVSMARGTPDSVDDSFFICVGDQAELDAGGMRNPDGYGFPAFGKVISGMDVVRKIHAMPTMGQKLVEDVQIILIERI